MFELTDRAMHRLRELRHNHVARLVLASPPAVPRDDGVIVFSMIGTRVLLPYLVAAKSLHARLGRGRFAILDDGTLTAWDRSVLAEHLGNPEVRSIADVDTGDCPRGGCWERLLTLLELRRDAYVVQFDSDTVTLGPVEEVAAAIAAGRNFTLRGGVESALLPVEAFASESPEPHIQTTIEARLGQIHAGLPEPRRYVRGCAGFAGFAPDGMGRDVADAFSREASALVGKARWSEWGSEQVMSNVIIAAEADPMLLPYDRYMNYWNEPAPADVRFVHFVGTYRYHRGAYAAATREALAAL